MKNKKIVILGSGAMATAMANVLHDAGQKNILIYGIDKKELSDLSNGKNSKYFPSTVKLPKFKTTNDIDIALKDASYIIIAVPSIAMDIVAKQINAKVSKEAIIVNLSKGFYPNTFISVRKGVSQKLKGNKYIKDVISLIGPSHAEEIVLRTPTSISTVGKNKKNCKEIQQLFHTNYFRTYIQTDVKGAEIGSIYKNVLAIASGMASGLGYGINTTAALLTRGLSEMHRYNKALGGRSKTIFGLAGVGDLIVTATSDLSRNYSFGKQFAKEGQKALKTNSTVEGLVALDSIYKIAKKKKIELPIVNLLYSVIRENADLQNSINSLWERPLKIE